MKSTTSWLALRAVLAIVLMLLFYALALGIIAALVWIPYAEFHYLHRIHPKLVLICLAGAGLIGWSILPRPDRFEAPGPRLWPHEQPKLFAAINEIAGKTEQAAPAEVYLVADVNAFVTQRGGIMGIGSRRVMGVGLPLVQALSVPQFKAVLAHEFGHFHGGDTKLGPWIYRTRSAIIRTVTTLAESGSYLRILFVGYAKLFLRITNAVSRSQEFVADELAARVVGARAHGDALRAIHGAAPAFDAYWRCEFAPALQGGYRPGLAEGFSLFLREAGVADAVKNSIQQQIDTSQTDPYDTHPSLRDRLERVDSLPSDSAPADATPAASLLSGIPDLEKQLLAYLFRDQPTGPLKPIEWKDVPSVVYLPIWKKVVEERRAGLSGVTVGSIPAFVRSKELEQYLAKSSPRKIPAEQLTNDALQTVGAALACALVRSGWRVESLPGAEFVVAGGGSAIKPFTVVADLASGKLADDDWRRQCESAGISGVGLGDSTT